MIEDSVTSYMTFTRGMPNVVLHLKCHIFLITLNMHVESCSENHAFQDQHTKYNFCQILCPSAIK